MIEICLPFFKTFRNVDFVAQSLQPWIDTTHKRLDDYADFLYNDEMVIVHLCPECAIIMLKNIIRNESDKSEWKQHELEKHWQEQMR